LRPLRRPRQFGADFRYHTQFIIHDGDSIVIGDGDPTFGDSEYLKASGWGTTTVFESWADQLQKQASPPCEMSSSMTVFSTDELI